MSRARIKKMAIFAQGKVLDIGFADAPNPYLAGDIVGFDIQKVHVPENYTAVTVGGVDNFCFKAESFDTILAGEIIEHLETPVQFVRDCYRLLKCCGRFILSTPNPYYPPYILLNWFLIRRYFYNSGHIFAFTPRLMMRICEQAGFEVERLISGGILIPYKRIPVPSPRAVCYQIIYVCRK